MPTDLEAKARELAYLTANIRAEQSERICLAALTAAYEAGALAMREAATAELAARIEQLNPTEWDDHKVRQAEDRYMAYRISHLDPRTLRDVCKERP